jgi:hypothetical protein
LHAREPSGRFRFPYDQRENGAVVLRFRLHLEFLGMAAGKINQKLAAVRRLAYEAADSGLLSSELVAGI